MVDESNQNSIAAQDSNKYYVNTNILEMRLNTDAVMNKIDTFLRGEIYNTIYDENGQGQVQVIPISKAKANEEGVQAIMNYIISIINPQVVQGNFPCDRHGESEMYRAFIDEVHDGIRDLIIVNCYKWDINDGDLGLIIDFIMNLIQPFMTRLIGNKERESYSETLRMTESNTLKDKSGFNLFKRNEQR